MPENLLFENPPKWTEHWASMPEFKQEDQGPYCTIRVHFKNDAAIAEFSRLVGQKVFAEAGRYTQTIWFPKAEIGSFKNKRYVAPEKAQLKYPLYIISKGRWESRFTSKALEKINVPYHIVVEPQEYDQYATVINPDKIYTLPFSNLGQGSIPARNWVWEHALKSGAERHWILDDNIKNFFRLNDNLKVPVSDGHPFCFIEDFVDRYDNIAQAGMNYFMFASRKCKLPPFVANTRIYSCILIKNDLPYRWRGRYNEDTDLSIRALKDGWCTVLFNAFLCEKTVTMTLKGGNTTELYKGDGRLKMAQSLQEQHPDIVKITTKWGRPQHHVDYSRFKKNKLSLKQGIILDEKNIIQTSLRVTP